MLCDNMLESIDPRSNSALNLWMMRRRNRQRIRDMVGEPDELTKAIWDIEDKRDAMSYRFYAELEAKQKAKAEPADDYTVNVKSTIKVKK